MSIPYSGTVSRSAGLLAAVGKQVKLINLRAAKRITVTFDPFSENVVPTRELLFHLSSPKVNATNPNCALRTNIVCNRQPPSVVFSLIDSVKDTSKLKEVKFNCEHLNTLELLQLCNKYVTSLAPKEEPVNVIKTKSEKKAAGKRK